MSDYHPPLRRIRDTPQIGPFGSSCAKPTGSENAQLDSAIRRTPALCVGAMDAVPRSTGSLLGMAGLKHGEHPLCNRGGDCFTEARQTRWSMRCLATTLYVRHPVPAERLRFARRHV